MEKLELALPASPTYITQKKYFFKYGSFISLAKNYSAILDMHTAELLRLPPA